MGFAARSSGSWKEFAMSLLDAPMDRVVRVFAGFSFSGNHLNRFTYLADTPSLTTTNLLAFLIEFDAVVLAAIAQLQVTALVWTTHSAQVLGGSKAYAELSLPRGGAVSGDGNGANIVYSFRFLRPATGVRGGFKRFSGVPETYTSNGSFIGANPPSTAVANVNGALAANITAGGVIYTPIILVDTVNGQALPNPKYYIPLGSQLRPKPGTQNTRKA